PPAFCLCHAAPAIIISAGMSETSVEADQYLELRNGVLSEKPIETKGLRKWKLKKFRQRRVKAVEMNKHEQVGKAKAKRQRQGQRRSRISRQRRCEQPGRQREHEGAAVEEKRNDAVLQIGRASCRERGERTRGDG